RLVDEIDPPHLGLAAAARMRDQERARLLAVEGHVRENRADQRKDTGLVAEPLETLRPALGEIGRSHRRERILDEIFFRRDDAVDDAVAAGIGGALGLAVIVAPSAGAARPDPHHLDRAMADDMQEIAREILSDEFPI